MLFSQQEQLYLTYIVRGVLGKKGYKHISKEEQEALCASIKEKVAEANDDMLFFYRAYRLPEWPEEVKS